MTTLLRRESEESRVNPTGGMGSLADGLDRHPAGGHRTGPAPSASSSRGCCSPSWWCCCSATWWAAAIDVPEAANYREFLMPGMFAMAMVFGLEGTFTAISNDVDQGRHRPVPAPCRWPPRRWSPARPRPTCSPPVLGAGRADRLRAGHRLERRQRARRRAGGGRAAAAGCGSRCCGWGSGSASRSTIRRP